MIDDFPLHTYCGGSFQEICFLFLKFQLLSDISRQVHVAVCAHVG